MLNKIRQFLKSESGAAAVEYGLITSGIAVAIIPSVTGVQQAGHHLHHHSEHPLSDGALETLR